MDFKFYSLEEVSEILDVTVRTLYRYIKDERLKANKVGGRWLVTQENLEKFIKGE